MIPISPSTMFIIHFQACTVTVARNLLSIFCWYLSSMHLHSGFKLIIHSYQIICDMHVFVLNLIDHHWCIKNFPMHTTIWKKRDAKKQIKDEPDGDYINVLVHYIWSFNYSDKVSKIMVNKNLMLVDNVKGNTLIWWWYVW